MARYAPTTPSSSSPRADALEAVRRFYDLHAYPPPIDSLGRASTSDLSERRRRYEHFLLWPRARFDASPTILVAGCGTSQAARYALRWPAARVLGIDVSTHSLEHSARLKQRHGLENLELLELPIERLPELGRRFRRIVCTGVLHHLADPEHGLRALERVLDPDGALQLMVYAPYGRTGIYLLQEYCRRLGLGTDLPTIRELTETLGALPGDHPIAPLLHKSTDFTTPSGVADALLHPCDRAYSVPALLELTSRVGLRFGRWMRQAPYLPSCGAPSRSPHAKRIESLTREEQYALVELFRGTLLRHSAVLYPRSERAASAPFGGVRDEWLGHVPIRTPESMLVARAGTGSRRAVLINRAHTHVDLYLPIGAREHGWLDAIDGETPLEEFEGGEQRRSELRTFMQRLWSYDHVVFDASNVEGTR